MHVCACIRVWYMHVCAQHGGTHAQRRHCGFNHVSFDIIRCSKSLTIVNTCRCLQCCLFGTDQKEEDVPGKKKTHNYAIKNMSIYTRDQLAVTTTFLKNLLTYTLYQVSNNAYVNSRGLLSQLSVQASIGSWGSFVATRPRRERSGEFLMCSFNSRKIGSRWGEW